MLPPPAQSRHQQWRSKPSASRLHCHRIQSPPFSRIRRFVQVWSVFPQSCELQSITISFNMKILAKIHLIYEKVWMVGKLLYFYGGLSWKAWRDLGLETWSTGCLLIMVRKWSTIGIVLLKGNPFTDGFSSLKKVPKWLRSIFYQMDHSKVKKSGTFILGAIGN